jgi:hypothetical protein
MILIDRFLSDEQDPKAVERVLGKLNDMLSSNEELIYLAVQKKPAVNLLPDCIAVSTKRMFYCEPGNFGITMNFKDISWKSVKEVSFKEEFFGSKFICVPQQGENIITEYIPKVQARKLYQAANEQLDNFRAEQQKAEQEEKRVQTSSATITPPIDEAVSPVVEKVPNEIYSPTADAYETQKPAAAMEDSPVSYNSSMAPVAPESASPFSTTPTSNATFSAAPSPAAEEPEDETTLKLRKLKTLFDKHLITQEEYDAKKADILDAF